MSELAQQPCVTVHVGNDSPPRAFGLHAALLKEVSRFFRACLSHDCIETATNEIHLPEHNAEAFGDFMNWLYTGATDIEMENSIKASRLREIYTLGDKLVCPKFQNIVMKNTLRFYQNTQIHPSYLNRLVESASGNPR